MAETNKLNLNLINFEKIHILLKKIAISEEINNFPK